MHYIDEMPEKLESRFDKYEQTKKKLFSKT